MNIETHTFGGVTLVTQDGEPIIAHQPFDSDEDDYMAMVQYLKLVVPRCALATEYGPNGFTYVFHPDPRADIQAVSRFDPVSEDVA